MVNVVVSRKRTIQVSTNATAGIIDSTTPVVLKNNPTLTTNGVDRLDHLKDVDATTELDGSTLIYDAATDKYVVRKINFGDVALDGGGF
jgi:hypothetical protein